MRSAQARSTDYREARYSNERYLNEMNGNGLDRPQIQWAYDLLARNCATATIRSANRVGPRMWLLGPWLVKRPRERFAMSSARFVMGQNVDVPLRAGFGDRAIASQPVVERASTPGPGSSEAGGAQAERSEFLPFAMPDLGEAEIAEVVDSLRSGWITTGPKARRFECAFGDFLGGDVEAVAVSSATAGLHLALEGLGFGPGDEVIVPVHTFTATAAAVAYQRARPVFVDVDPNTLNIDSAAVAAAVTPRTRAIIPVHFAGLACDMAPLMDLAERHALEIVEDAAHALPNDLWGPDSSEA